MIFSSILFNHEVPALFPFTSLLFRGRFDTDTYEAVDCLITERQANTFWEVVLSITEANNLSITSSFSSISSNQACTPSCSLAASRAGIVLWVPEVYTQIVATAFVTINTRNESLQTSTSFQYNTSVPYYYPDTSRWSTVPRTIPVDVTTFVVNDSLTAYISLVLS